jgi:hypothetical protein
MAISNISDIVSQIAASHVSGGQQSTPVVHMPPRRLSERIWQSVTTLRGRFIIFALLIVVFACITAVTILLSAIRANDDLNTINKPGVDAAQAIVPYIENIDAQTASYLADTNPTDLHPCAITDIGLQQPNQQASLLSTHDCADRTINADVQKIDDELYTAGHNVSFSGEQTAIVQIELGLEEYISDINLMRSEYQQASNPHSPNDSHMQQAYRYAIAATNVLHQQIVPMTAASSSEPGLPACKLDTQTLAAQTWPKGGIEQNVSCLSAISKANLDAAYNDTVKFVGISLGLVFGLCIYTCIFIAWATWSMASTTHRLINVGLGLTFIIALVFTGLVLSDFDAIYGYKGNFSIIQHNYGIVYNAGLLEQNSADANADQAHWLLALQFNDPGANHWYSGWQAKQQAVHNILQQMQNSNQSAQSQALYTRLTQDWRAIVQYDQAIDAQAANGSSSDIASAEQSYVIRGNQSFQTFLYDVNRLSISYSQQYNSVFSQTGALLKALMLWCSAIFLLPGILAAWCISRRLPEF